MRTSALFALLTTGMLTFAAAGGEPVPVPPWEPSPPPYFLPQPIHRIDRYAVWQDYAVDRQGYFRTRVIDTPYGAYYHFNGKPYPFLYLHPLDYMPYASE